ncbi:hypothetical protein FANTH_5650 [Fusarium anthophilum]|uniref:Uncharacterized protein n=1 Tax=Fusarium anthophilum TaxID=48485 RepID=A0A8H5E6V0_9HYPO|nr:hypothetical protein FANTH_5650 [Fusarium anthophilum]
MQTTCTFITQEPEDWPNILGSSHHEIHPYRIDLAKGAEASKQTVKPLIPLLSLAIPLSGHVDPLSDHIDPLSDHVDPLSSTSLVPLLTVSSSYRSASPTTIMADAGGGKSGHSSYDGVVQEAGFGPQSSALVESSGDTAKKRREDARKAREENAVKSSGDAAKKRREDARKARAEEKADDEVKGAE